MQTHTPAYYALILRYLGMSFITGAVAHGFFSGYRSVATATIGILFFLGAIWFEKDRSHLTYHQILWSTLLAIGVGVFTGGIQHFPDSPERSIWIVPLGFILALFAFARSEQISYSPRDKRSLLISSIIVMLLSVCVFSLFEFTSLVGDHHISTTDRH